jgi:Ca2+-binding EF-hand superfamily protein
MRVWTLLLSLALALLVTTNVPAQEKKPPAQKHPVAERFAKMDTNHDGILTETEFVAARAKMGEAKAKKVYEEMCKLGGTTTKDKATGMTLEQFKKAFEEWRKSHPRKAPPGN